MEYYIASCMFTSKFPVLSEKIQRYIREKHNISIVRCCIPNYKLKEFEDKMPEGSTWPTLPDCADFQAGDVVYSLCHNCSNVIEETKPEVINKSLWELILSDEAFEYPDFSGMNATVQDCWRAKERSDEQEAVRGLLRKMKINFIEADENHAETDFCGTSLYRPQPSRNIRLAPKHYVEGAEGKFEPHTPEEHERLMREYCSRFKTETVVCYCHYCLEGLELGGVDAKHIAELLFD